MLGNLKRFKVFIAFIFVFSVISFNGIFDSDRTGNIPVSNLPDIDNLEVQNLINGYNVSFTDQNTLPLATVSVTPRTFLSPGVQLTNQSRPRNGSGFFLVDTFTITGNPGVANNGGSAGWAMFLDLIAGPRNLVVTQMSTASTAAANGSFTVDVYTRHGTSLGGPVGSGPGSSTAGWTLLGTAPVTQGPTLNGISLVFTIPPITINALDTVGVALKFAVVGPRYFGTGSPPIESYSDTNITLKTGEGRSAPFTPTGSWFSSRALTGVIRYVMGPPLGITYNGSQIPDNFSLSQNYPNPFNPVTKINFAIPKNEFVKMSVFDMLGKEIEVLINRNMNAGSYSVDFDASHLSSGIYFYRITAGNFDAVKRMVLVK